MVDRTADDYACLSPLLIMLLSSLLALGRCFIDILIMNSLLIEVNNNPILKRRYFFYYIVFQFIIYFSGNRRIYENILTILVNKRLINTLVLD